MVPPLIIAAIWLIAGVVGSFGAQAAANTLVPAKPPETYCQSGYEYQESVGCVPTAELAAQLYPEVPEPTPIIISPATPKGGVVLGQPVWVWGISITAIAAVGALLYGGGTNGR